jgi:hypothetical protein
MTRSTFKQLLLGTFTIVVVVIVAAVSTYIWPGHAEEAATIWPRHAEEAATVEEVTVEDMILWELSPLSIVRGLSASSISLDVL